jgi:hypothetical protein
MNDHAWLWILLPCIFVALAGLGIRLMLGV